MKHSTFLNILYSIYKDDKNKFMNNPTVNKLAFQEYKIDGSLNQKKHFELLQSIIYKLLNEDLELEYLYFLQSLLFTILEENSISLMYNLKDSNLRDILSKYDRSLGPNIFYTPNKGISISNTQIHNLIDKLIKQKKSNYSLKSKSIKSYQRTGKGTKKIKKIKKIKKNINKSKRKSIKRI